MFRFSKIDLIKDIITRINLRIKVRPITLLQRINTCKKCNKQMLNVFKQLTDVTSTSC